MAPCVPKRAGRGKPRLSLPCKGGYSDSGENRPVCGTSSKCLSQIVITIVRYVTVGIAGVNEGNLSERVFPRNK